MSSPVRDRARHIWPCGVAAADGLHPNAVPFPFGDVVGRIETAEIVSSIACASITAGTGRVEIDRLVAVALSHANRSG